MSRIAVFHPGTQHSRQTAYALQKMDRLAWYATGLYLRDAASFERVLHQAPGPIKRRLGDELARLHDVRLDDNLIRIAGWHEWAERLARRMAWPDLAGRLDAAGNAAFASRVTTWVAQDRPAALWGYDGCAAAVFANPNMRAIPRILDRTIADWRQWNVLLERIGERDQAWLTPAIKPVSDSQIAQDDSEYAAADVILCGSRQVATSVQHYSPVNGLAAKTRVLPYCYDDALFDPSQPLKPTPRDGPVKLLFVGQIGVRKGAHHVLEAIAQIPPSQASLTMVGPMQLPRTMVARFADRFTHIPGVPRTRIPAIMRDHHALLLPSYFEGSAITLLEALASGLAIVQTRAAGLGATDKSGIVLDEPDSAAMEQAIADLIADRARLHAMREQACIEAPLYEFANYCAGIALLLDDIGI